MAPEISNTRNLAIDLVKIVAMTLVVALHTTRAYIDSYSLSDPSAVIYYTGVVAIPLFFMVSGYLLLGRDTISYHYSAKKIFSIIRFLLIFIILSWLPHVVFRGAGISELGEFLLDCILSRGFFGVLWYLVAMCIIYLLLPILNKIYQHRSSFIALCAVGLLMQNVAFLGNVTDFGEWNVPQTFRLWNWLTYFIIGGAMHHISLSRTLLKWAIFPLLLLTLIFILHFNSWMDVKLKLAEYDYASLIVMILSCACFLLIKGTKIKDSKIIKALSSLFLPVYVIHPYVINNLRVHAFMHGLGSWGGNLLVISALRFSTHQLDYYENSCGAKPV